MKENKHEVSSKERLQQFDSIYMNEGVEPAGEDELKAY